MTFADNVKADAVNVILSGEFSEEITYTPGGGSAKVIKAIVGRDALGRNSENKGRSLRSRVKVSIADDEINGVSSINKIDDWVTFTDSEGNTRNARIVDIESRSSGMWRLQVEW